VGGAYSGVASYDGGMSTPEETPPLPPILVKSETVAWLKARLSAGSHRIAPLVAEWCGGQKMQAKGSVVWEGGRDGANGRWISELMQARAMLGLEAHLDDSGCYCWRLPRPGRQ
jgi:hypothetical protein